MTHDETTPLAGDQLRARIAWYYYVAGLTQQEISERLGIARARVNKIAGQLRTDGAVVVDIRLPLASCVELEEALRARYRLEFVSVVPSDEDEDRQRRMLGDAGGVMLDAMIRDGQSIAVGWGQTLSASFKRLRPRKLKSSSVISLMGGLKRASEANSFDVSTELARTLGSDCYFLTAPVYCPSIESREILLTHGGVNDVMARARKSDMAIISCGDLTPGSQMTPLGTISSVRERLPELEKMGAIGEILGTFLDKDGKPVDHMLNRSVIALPPDDLKTIPRSILISGGLHKAGIIQAILNGGYVNCLVTDEAVARKLIGEQQKVNWDNRDPGSGSGSG